ncbi:MAG: hypothetical protein HY815_04780 [Candidatus Riflebacteria bacterium]|nr:hypothetical protein [Candidatus Riflebacteria bacterium]
MNDVKRIRVWAIATVLVAAVPVRADLEMRIVTGPGVKFAVPADASRGRFTPQADGRSRYEVTAGVGGLGKLSVVVGHRGDPEASLQNEVQGAQALARTAHFRRTEVRTVEVNRGRGVQGVEHASQGREVAHCITWSKKRQFEFRLEGARSGVDPLHHPVWKKLLASFRSDEPPLKGRIGK